MAAKKIIKKDVVLKCALGLHGKDGKPGTVVSLPEEQADALIKAGHAYEPAVGQSASSDASALVREMEQTIADLEKELATVREDCTAKLDQAKAYVVLLEDRCKANGVDIADLTGNEK